MAGKIESSMIYVQVHSFVIVVDTLTIYSLPGMDHYHHLRVY